MSLIFSRSPPETASVSTSKERRWISMRCGTSRGFSRREKLLRVTGAALERAKSATPRAVRGMVKKARAAGRRTQKSARPGEIARWFPRSGFGSATGPQSRAAKRRLFQLDGRAGLLEFGFQFFGLGALDALFDRARSGVDR